MEFIVGKLYRAQKVPILAPPWGMPAGTLGILLKYEERMSEVYQRIEMTFLLGDKIRSFIDSPHLVDKWLEGPL